MTRISPAPNVPDAHLPNLRAPLSNVSHTLILCGEPPMTPTQVLRERGFQRIETPEGTGRGVPRSSFQHPSRGIVDCTPTHEPPAPPAREYRSVTVKSHSSLVREDRPATVNTHPLPSRPSAALDNTMTPNAFGTYMLTTPQLCTAKRPLAAIEHSDGMEAKPPAKRQCDGVRRPTLTTLR